MVVERAARATTAPTRAIQIGSDWYASTDYETHQTSLTKAQAVTDPDGVMRFVISERPPGGPGGIANWLETTGHRTGPIMLRWQRLERDLGPEDGPTVRGGRSSPTYRTSCRTSPRSPPRSTPRGSPPGSAPWPEGCSVERADYADAHDVSIEERYEPVPLLKDKVVVLSGVGPGLGRALGEEAARMGADLVLVSRTERRLEKMAEVVRGHGRRALVVPTDITDEDSRTRLRGAGAGGVRQGRLPAQQRVRDPADGPDHPARRWRACARPTRPTCSRRCGSPRCSPTRCRPAAGRSSCSTPACSTPPSPSTPATSCPRAPSPTSPPRSPPSWGRAGSGSTASPRRTSTRTSTRPTSTGSPPSPAAPTRRCTPRRRRPTDLKRLASPQEVARATLFYASDLASAVTGTVLNVDCGEFHDN